MAPDFWDSHASKTIHEPTLNALFVPISCDFVDRSGSGETHHDFSLSSIYFLLLFVGFGPLFGRNERFLVINQHNRPHRQKPTYLNCRRHGNANAAVTLRTLGDRRISMNRQSVAEVAWVIKQS